MGGYTVIMLEKKHVLALKRLLANLKFHQLLSGAYFGGRERCDKTIQQWSKVYFLHLWFQGEGHDSRARSHLCTSISSCSFGTLSQKKLVLMRASEA